MTLPSDWYGVAGILIVQFFVFMQSRRNFATAKQAHSAAKEVGSEVNEIKEQVTNGGTNLADVVGQINRRTVLMETYLENLPSQQNIKEMRGDISHISGRIDSLEGRFRRHFPEE